MKTLWRMVFIFFPLTCLMGYTVKSSSTQKKIQVFVSILPLKDFVEQIGKDRVDVQVMVLPGQSPATYAPKPKQMQLLSKADLYFRIGVPFENVWMSKMHQINPQLSIVDLRQGLKMIEKEDSHVWTSPPYVMIMCHTIMHHLIKLDGSNQKFYEKNYEVFKKKLQDLDAWLHQELNPYQGKSFLVFHPAWGYFARTYGLRQMAIEKEGKEPGPKDIVQIIAQAKKENIHTIFVQKQFDQKNARVIAEALHAQVVVIDPLAEKYILNMKNFGNQLISSFKYEKNRR